MSITILCLQTFPDRKRALTLSGSFFNTFPQDSKTSLNSSTCGTKTKCRKTSLYSINVTASTLFIFYKLHEEVATPTWNGVYLELCCSNIVPAPYLHVLYPATITISLLCVCVCVCVCVCACVSGWVGG